MKILTLLLLSLSLNLLANPCRHTITSFRCAKFINNYDGDTINFEIRGVHPIIGRKMPVRVKGINTPEIRTKNKCEYQLAIKAKAFVHNVLSKAKRIDLDNLSRGKYFRLVADITVDSKDLKTMLLRRRLGHIYDGQGPRKIDWCRFIKN